MADPTELDADAKVRAQRGHRRAARAQADRRHGRHNRSGRHPPELLKEQENRLRHAARVGIRDH